MATDLADLQADFMELTTGWHLRTRVEDARLGLVPVAGQYVTVGCEDADPAVARVLSVNAEGDIELEVLPGDVDSHRDLLASR